MQNAVSDLYAFLHCLGTLSQKYFNIAEVAGFTSFPFTVSTSSRHFFRKRTSSFFQPISLIRASTCFFQVVFGLLLFLLPFTSKFNAYFRMLSSSPCKMCPHHLITAAAFIILSIDAVKPNIFALIFCFFSIFQFHSAYGSYCSSFNSS